MNHATTQTEWKVMLVVTILSLWKPLKSKQRPSPSSNRLSSVGERPRYDTQSWTRNLCRSRCPTEWSNLCPSSHTKLDKSQCALKMVARLVRQDKEKANGRHYTRSIGIHKLVLEALFRLQMQAFEKPRCSTRYLDINFAEIAPWRRVSETRQLRQDHAPPQALMQSTGFFRLCNITLITACRSQDQPMSRVFFGSPTWTSCLSCYDSLEQYNCTQCWYCPWPCADNQPVPQPGRSCMGMRLKRATRSRIHNAFNAMSRMCRSSWTLWLIGSTHSGMIAHTWPPCHQAVLHQQMSSCPVQLFPGTPSQQRCSLQRRC